MIGSVIFSMLSGTNLFGIKFGVAIVKIFQLIEILAKLVFMPVFFSDILKDVLYVIYKMGDPFDLDSNALIDYPIDKNISSNRGKITLFEEYSNILQAFPLMSLVLFIVLISEGLIKLIRFTVPGLRQRKFFKIIVSCINMLVYLLIEMNLVDYVFYSAYNIHQAGTVTDHKEDSLISGKKVSLFVSFTILSRIAFMQVKIFMKSMNLKSKDFNQLKLAESKKNQNESILQALNKRKDIQAKQETHKVTHSDKNSPDIDYERITENLKLDSTKSKIPWQACYVYPMFNIKLFILCILLTTM